MLTCMKLCISEMDNSLCPKVNVEKIQPAKSLVGQDHHFLEGKFLLFGKFRTIFSLCLWLVVVVHLEQMKNNENSWEILALIRCAHKHCSIQSLSQLSAKYLHKQLHFVYLDFLSFGLLRARAQEGVFNLSQNWGTGEMKCCQPLRREVQGLRQV